LNKGSIVYETQHGITFRTTPEVIAAFESEKIFFGKASDELFDERIFFPKSISVEPYTTFSGRTLFECGSFSYSETLAPLPLLRIGRYCSIAYGLQVLGVRHPIERVTSSSITYDFNRPDGYRSFDAAHTDLLDNTYKPNIPARLEEPYPIVEHDVWIGQNVQLSRGIRIGTGSVIAAGSVVTHDVEPYSIVGGVPARVIRRRFPNEISDRLLRMVALSPQSSLQARLHRRPRVSPSH
jgi:acetyltransferase-like isoleucine patch superfamily enzyme